MSDSIENKNHVDGTERKRLSNSGPMSKENILIRAVDANDLERVVDFLRINFIPNEPLNMGIEIKHERSSNGEYIMAKIAHGTCLMAVEQSDGGEVILGVVIAAPKHPNEAELLFKKAAVSGLTKLGHIMLFLACFERDANVFERYGVSVALHVNISCVDANKRGRSISKLLKRELVVLGRKLGYPLITADSTSYYSARVNEQLGWECIHTLRYDEYLDKDGKQIFNPPAPHEIVKSYAMRL